MVSMPLPVTSPNTVKPPFWLSRFSELSARLKKNSLVALSGSPPSFCHGYSGTHIRDTWLIDDRIICLNVHGPAAKEITFIRVEDISPICSMKPGTLRWIKVPS
jgi:hypothetical protein